MLGVGRDVEARLAMYPADASGGKDLDARLIRCEHRPRDGGPAAGFFYDSCGKIAAADLHAAAALDLDEFLVCQADADHAIEDGDGGGRRAVSVNGGLHVATKREVVRRREAVREDGGVETCVRCGMALKGSDIA